MRYAMRIALAIVLIIGVVAMGACADAKREEPVKLVFDTDMGNDIDDAIALALIHALADRGEVDPLAITVSKDNTAAGVYVDVVDCFYGRPKIPIGMVHNGKTPENGYANVVAERKVGNAFAYPRANMTANGKPDAVDVLRRTLAAQPDGSVTVVSVGFMTNLARLLESSADKRSPLDGRELVKRKVKLYVMMAGAFGPGAKPEYNVYLDADAARKVFAQWPTQIVASGFEVGTMVVYPAESIERDYGYVADHPVVEAYRAYGKMPYDRPMWDPTAVLYAIRPSRGYFGLSSPGRISLDDKNVTQFTPDEKGLHRYLTVSDEQAARAREAIVWAASTPPRKLAR